MPSLLRRLSSLPVPEGGGICLDIEDLLNARTIDGRPGIGLPDLGEIAEGRDTGVILARLVLELLSAAEPRLKNIRVVPGRSDEPGAIVLEVDAELVSVVSNDRVMLAIVAGHTGVYRSRLREEKPWIRN